MIKSDDNGHKWISWHTAVSWLACEKCGIVQRIDGQNKPCPGSVKIVLRGKEEAMLEARKEGGDE